MFIANYTFDFSDEVEVAMGVNLAERAMNAFIVGRAALKAGDLEIPMSSNGVVKPDGSSIQAGLDPSANSTGFIWQVGITYDISL